MCSIIMLELYFVIDVWKKSKGLIFLAEIRAKVTSLKAS